jgi:hypothetical protein
LSAAFAYLFAGFSGFSFFCFGSFFAFSFGFGGVEGVIKGKSELYDYLKSHDQFILINENDEIQVEKNEGYDLIIPFGRRDSEFYFEKIVENNCVGLLYKEVEALSNLTGEYNFTNYFLQFSQNKTQNLFYQKELPNHNLRFFQLEFHHFR